MNTKTKSAPRVKTTHPAPQPVPIWKASNSAEEIAEEIRRQLGWDLVTHDTKGTAR
jgi:flavodoxin